MHATALHGLRSVAGSGCAGLRQGGGRMLWGAVTVPAACGKRLCADPKQTAANCCTLPTMPPAAVGQGSACCSRLCADPKPAAAPSPLLAPTRSRGPGRRDVEHAGASELRVAQGPLGGLPLPGAPPSGLVFQTCRRRPACLPPAHAGPLAAAQLLMQQRTGSSQPDLFRLCKLRSSDRASAAATNTPGHAASWSR